MNKLIRNGELSLNAFFACISYIYARPFVECERNVNEENMKILDKINDSNIRKHRNDFDVQTYVVILKRKRKMTGNIWKIQSMNRM